MDLGLRGKVAIVTGSSDGIGYGVAHALAEEGVRVVLCARRESLLAEVRQAIERETGAEVFAVPCDVQRLNDVQSLVKETARRFGAIHILVNNAGSVPSIQFASVEDAQWHQMLGGEIARVHSRDAGDRAVYGAGRLGPDYQYCGNRRMGAEQYGYGNRCKQCRGDQLDQIHVSPVCGPRNLSDDRCARLDRDSAPGAQSAAGGRCEQHPPAPSRPRRRSRERRSLPCFRAV